ncbi:metalloprotease-like protein [Ophiostoma piceae UAMH 11346]|uniref:Metalloprotease-like protein n=1 Tax=Ophiostoma piceae (strain UAMH 11346) TaxID=1262450 RepID=S3C4K7_OPHP1|nr:metalloprotease-like protein [Ophiostoma piceae UAMH 11346]
MEDEIQKLRAALAAEKKRADDETKRADVEKKRADDAKKRADDEKKRTDDEKKRADDEQKRAEDEKKRAEDEQKRADDEKKRADDEKKRADDEVAKNQKTVYFEYLDNTHTHIASTLLVETDRSKAASGKAAKANGKVYPRVLRRWVDFPQLHRQQFDDLTTLFGDNRLFPSYNDTRSIASDLSPRKRRDEQDIRPYIRAYLELPATHIIKAFLQRTTEPSYAGLSFHFSNNTHGTAAQRRLEPDLAASAHTSAGGPSRSSSRKRKLDSSTSLAPDRWGQRVREDQSADDDEYFENILPGEYKAAHKVRGSDFRRILGNHDAPPAESFIGDCAQKLQQDGVAIAEVLCQAYHYMVVYGKTYSYVTSGEGTVLLMAAPENAATLLYHYIGHAAVASPITQPERDLVCVPAAQMATLIVKALVADPYPMATSTTLLNDLPRWPKPLATARRLASSGPQGGGSPPSEGDDDNDNDDDRGRDSGMPPPPAPSFGGHGDSATQPRSDSAGGASRPFDRFELPRREYCTQRCLLGLCRGGPLDRNCPNMSEHASGERRKTGADGRPHHPISAVELCAMLLDQFTNSLSAGLECLMKYGMFGTIGTLFKVTLCAYGYTFVAKGVQDAHQHALREEATLYADAATQHLQGVLMPVYLGCIELEEWPYILPSGALIWHLMFLSWAGVSLAKRVPECLGDVDDVIDDMYCELYSHGIFHQDVREANLAWNPELGRVMAIDFDRAFVMDEEDYAESPPPPSPVASARLVARIPQETKIKAKLAGEKRGHGGTGDDGVEEKRMRMSVSAAGGEQHQ